MSVTLDQHSYPSTPALQNVPVPTIRLTTATPTTGGRDTAATVLAPKGNVEPRRRLVPKRSKLGLSTSESSTNTAHVAPKSSAGRSFSIYVDPADDPDIGEIVVLKKKKSRGGLNDLQWGPLGDVTNAPSSKSPLPTAINGIPNATGKGEDKDKWWTLRKGKRDTVSRRALSLKATVDNKQPKVEEDGITKLVDKASSIRLSGSVKKSSTSTRLRSHSLDASSTLSGSLYDPQSYQPSLAPTPNFISVPMPDDEETVRRPLDDAITQSRPRSRLRSGTASSLVSSQSSSSNDNEDRAGKTHSRNGSIALRAMRSVRSIARMTSWAKFGDYEAETESESEYGTEAEPGSGTETEREEDLETPRVSKSKTSKAKSFAKLGKIEKPKKSKNERKLSISSISSFEVLKKTFGTVRHRTASHSNANSDQMGTMRSVSSQSSGISSSEGYCTTFGDGSRESHQEGRERKDKGTKRAWKAAGDLTIRKGKSSPAAKEQTARGTKGRRIRRATLSSLFSRSESSATSASDAETQDEGDSSVDLHPDPETSVSSTLLNTSINTAESDHDATPTKKARVRPVSEQLLTRTRPKGVLTDQETGAIRVLDAATTDLASLVNKLDLESTPTPTPRHLRRLSSRDFSQFDSLITEQSSPTKDRDFESKFSSDLATTSLPQTTIRISQRRSHSTSTAEMLSQKFNSFLIGSPKLDTTELSPEADTTILSDESSNRQSLKTLSADVSRSGNDRGTSEMRSVSDSFATFGRHAFHDGWSFQSNDIRSLLDRGSSVADPNGDVFSVASGESRRRSISMRERTHSSMAFSAASTELGCQDYSDDLKHVFEDRSLSEREGRHNDSFILDHPSTMLPPLPPSPSSSQRLEALSILSTSYPSIVYSPSRPQYYLPPASEMILDVESPVTPVGSVTKLSFDFTEELNQIDAGDTSEQQDFALQVDAAFKTPRKNKVSRRPLGSGLGLFDVGSAPPLPPLPPQLEDSRSVQAYDITLPDSPPFNLEAESSFGSSSNSASDQLDLDKANEQDLCIKQPSKASFLGVFSRPSEKDKEKNGQLRKDCKFGASNLDSSIESTRDREQRSTEKSTYSPDADADSIHRGDCETGRGLGSARTTIGKVMSMADFFADLANHRRDACSGDASRSSLALTLSDIIPPSLHESRRGSYYSVNDDEASVLNAIFAKAYDESQGFRLSHHEVEQSSAFESTGEFSEGQVIHPGMQSRRNSEVSFTGLPTFSEIRRGFEYGSSRPVFYPSSNAEAQSNNLMVPGHQWRDSLMSIASVSSYGHVLRSGAKDPFGYANPTSSSAQPSGPRPLSGDFSITVDDTFSFLRKGGRPRIDSDASSLRVSLPIQHRPNVQSRRNRRQGIDSMVSLASGPPVSLYNRGFSYYGSKANDTNATAQFALLARANGLLGIPTRERKTSIDSMASGLSVRQLGRPGIGDKMFESARDHGIPLSSIEASPSHVEPWDSSTSLHVDGDDESVNDPDVVGMSNLSHESLFEAVSEGAPLSTQDRPMSPMSSYSFKSSFRDNASVISMLGGGHISRQSIESSLNGSPCARAEKRNRRFFRRPLERIPSGDAAELLLIPPSVAMSANSSLVSLNDAPSPTSRRSIKSVEISGRPDESRFSIYFGSNRMSMARKGLLERQSLENFCLTGEGEDLDQPVQPAAVFRRPARPRNKSNTSQSTGSQTHAGIDQGKGDNALAHPSEAFQRIQSQSSSRLRKNALDLRRRVSLARASRTSSIYETIQEEGDNAIDEFGALMAARGAANMSSASQRSSFISIDRDDDTAPALRMIYELQNEARLALEASQRQWSDTTYSVDALQTYDPPNNVMAWKAILEHSQKNFVPLPAEFHGCARRPRSRTFLRSSPYPTTSYARMSRNFF